MVVRTRVPLRNGLSVVMKQLVSGLAFLGFSPGLPLPAQESRSSIVESELRTAIACAIPLLEKASAGFVEQRDCFSCHSQAIPVFVLTKAQKMGFVVDRDNLQRQIDHTFAHLKRGLRKYSEGTGQGGKVVTAGYALWTLDAGGHEPDDITAAVSGFLLGYQEDSNHWQHTGRRPPSSGSPFMTSYVAMRGLDSFGTTEQQERITERRSALWEWLNNTNPKDTEDHVFRLRLLSSTQYASNRIDQAREELLALQRVDGGWAQLPDMESDAYATGTVVSALLSTNVQIRHGPAVRRAIKYLLNEQHDDGSWLVHTRAEGFQEYFESGFPHDKHQFISTSATSWATLALLDSLTGIDPDSNHRTAHTAIDDDRND